MYSFQTNCDSLKNEFIELIRQFLPKIKTPDFSVSHNVFPSGYSLSELKESGGFITNNISVNGEEFIFKNAVNSQLSSIEYKRIYNRCCKHSLYKAFKGHFKVGLPWGSLTGVRPTKLAYQMLLQGADYKNIAAALENEFEISSSKAKLIEEIVFNQKDYIKHSKNRINLYIHIPFCPSRCYYCSFVSVPAEKQKKLISPYVDALIKEIEITKKIIADKNYIVDSVYIGGGTPTVLCDSDFEKILSKLDFDGVEFTCEAGRPDTITEEKLLIMKKHGVTRVSVNPQTLNDNTLKIIGRNHTAKEFFEKFSLAKSYGFIINVDLIAGLKGENQTDFKYTLDNIVKLLPHNITVHTLSQKNGSALKESEEALQAGSAAQMIEYAYEKLHSEKYLPYYLYRQKLMSDNLENSGFSLKGFECINNINTMEESLSVIASGAGGISKRIFDDNTVNSRIERHANIKDIEMYLEEFDSQMIKKEKFWQN